MTPRLGLIARADRGGLAAQTRELYRHLQPDRTLVVDLGRHGRGPCDRTLYPNARYTRGGGLLSTSDAEWLCSDVDIVFTVETPYGPALWQTAAVHHTPVVLQVNPELYDSTETRGFHVVLPTHWEEHRIPGAPVLHMPVATDRLPRRTIDHVRTFVHHAAPAFHDRNGTHLVLAALEHVTESCTVIMRAPANVAIPTRVGPVEVLHNVTETADYWDAWPDQADCLLLPRRYGGLSLPMNEAAALGLPIITLDLMPQRRWIPPTTRVPVTSSKPVAMKGGIFRVHDASPSAIAERMDFLIRNPHRAKDAAAASAAWGDRISWDRELPRYRAFLDELVSTHAA